jgi:hypothetical protein
MKDAMTKPESTSNEPVQSSAPKGVESGPPASIVVGAISTQRVQRGKDLVVDVASELLDSRGQGAVPQGTSVWTATTSAPSVVISANRHPQYKMNGQITSRNVTTSFDVTYSVTTTEYPFTASKRFSVLVI